VQRGTGSDTSSVSSIPKGISPIGSLQSAGTRSVFFEVRPPRMSATSRRTRLVTFESNDLLCREKGLLAAAGCVLGVSTLTCRAKITARGILCLDERNFKS
jgi:hypothetical protein